jgi:sugar-phosphatase
MRIDCLAVLFDLDGVLVDSAPVVERTWNRWAARHALSVPDLVHRAHGRRSIETLQAVAPWLDAVEESAWLTAAELADTDGLQVMSGAAAALDALVDARYAIVTSCGRRLAELRLRCVGLRVPRVLISADDVAAGKPAPDGYVAAARALGVDPRECVIIEDAPAGVAAGVAAGARVLALTTTFPHARLTQAHAIRKSLGSLTFVYDGEGISIAGARFPRRRSDAA